MCAILRNEINEGPFTIGGIDIDTSHKAQFQDLDLPMFNFKLTLLI